MSNINTGRFHTNHDKDFVLFLLGMKVHRFYKVHKWLLVFSKVPAMFAEFEREKRIGYLGGHYQIRLIYLFGKNLINSLASSTMLE